MSLLETVGQVTASDVFAPRDVPPLTNAAMDGYAVRGTDIAGATLQTPVRLKVRENLAAGRVARLGIEPGTAIRIMTGAPVPDGADTVVPFEDTSESSERLAELAADRIDVFVAWREGANIRRAGEDLARGDLIIPQGTIVRPAHVGACASMGFRALTVYRRPRIGILSTGDELLEPGQTWTPGKIYDANSYVLHAMTVQCGGEVVRLGIAPDDPDALMERIAACDGLDMLVTSAGVSAGDFDVVKTAMLRAGDVTFYRVRMRPGRPLAFGRLGGVPLVGLPGNPVAASIGFEVFCRPAIRRMLGKTDLGRPTVRAEFRGRVDNYDRRRSFYRVQLERSGDRTVARLTGPQGSGILRSLVIADGLMVIPEDRPTAITGEEVTVMLIHGIEDG